MGRRLSFAESWQAESILSYGVILLFLALWFITQIDLSINPDNAFLTTSAIKFLSGEQMSEAYYDTNPPLSFLIYLPAAALVLYLKIPIYYAVFFYGCAVLLLCSCALFLLLKTQNFLTPQERHLILGIFMLTNTFAVTTFFAERDHIIALALCPFLLLQLVITRKKEVDRALKFIVLAFGSLCILIKPHYGLLPVLIIMHRVFSQRRMSVAMDIDFLALAIACISYALVIVFLLPDYLSVIFWDTFLMYAFQKEAFTYGVAFDYAVALFALLLFCCLVFKPSYKPATFALIAALLCLAIYTLQGKGYLYQLIPFYVFFFAGLSLVLKKLILTGFQSVSIKPFSFLTPLILGFFALVFHVVFAPKIPFLTHEEYKKTELAQIVTECENPCSFFMFNDRIDIVHELSVYTRQPHASRFPTFFFLPFLFDSNAFFSDSEKQKLTSKYLDMVARDFEHYEPDTLMIGEFSFENKDQPFDFMRFLERKNPKFVDIFSKYNKIRRIKIDQNAYTGGIFITAKPVDYTIYKRKKDK